MNEPWTIVENITANEFVLKMLELGKPVETSIVGVFNDDGRGSKRDIDLPFHRDGDYSAKVAEEKGQSFDKNVDIVGLYCIREGDSVTLIKHGDHEEEVVLRNNQALIFDNKKCLHARRGKVGDRILLRMWVSTSV
jgi:hypothetical protein